MLVTPDDAPILYVTFSGIPQVALDEIKRIGVTGEVPDKNIDVVVGNAANSAWASEQNLVLGQRCEEGKSSEITAIPGSAGRAGTQEQHRDAGRDGRNWQKFRVRIRWKASASCQTVIAAHILDRGADYLLALKGNHGRAHKAVIEHFARTCFDIGDTVPAVHDRGNA